METHGCVCCWVQIVQALLFFRNLPDFRISISWVTKYHKPNIEQPGNPTSYVHWNFVGPSCLLMTSSISFPTLSTSSLLNSQSIGQPLRSQLGYKTRSPTLKRFKSYTVDLKTMENTTKTNVIKTHFGCWDVPLSTNTGAREETITKVEWITFSIILLLDMWSSWSLLLGPYTWSKVHKGPCVGGDDPPTIRNTRNVHPGTTSRIKKHELAAPWSMRVFLHCAFLWRQCQLLVQLSNVSDSKQTKTNPSPLNREAGKDFWTIWNFHGWIQFQVLQSLAVTQPL